VIKELEFLLSPLHLLKGIKEKTENVYRKLLTSRRILDLDKEPKVIDLLYHKPQKIVYRKQNPDLSNLEDGDLITARVMVYSHEKPIRNGQPYRIICGNRTGFITVIYFKAIPQFILKNFKEEANVVISGKIERFNNEIQMSHPDYINDANIPSFEPIYPLTAGLTNRSLRWTIQNILPMVPDLPEWLDNNFLFEHQWKSWRNSLISLHNAKTNEELAAHSPYVERLAFDELLANQIAIGIMRKRVKNNLAKNKLLVKNDSLKNYFLHKLPFEPTNDQQKATTEIENDIYSNRRMLRLLQGDVGSGKTVVAFLTMLPFLQNRKQVVLMVPTSILATQHYSWISKICEGVYIDTESTMSEDKEEFSDKDIETIHSDTELILSQKIKRPIKLALLTGKIKGKKREKILNDLKSGAVDILIGTHAVFQENVEFRDLGYTIIDEQHRFGVSQRLNLIEKGKNIDILIMTATPIPRTLALTIYGDMDISTIQEKPKSRKEIITSTLQSDRFNELIYRLKEKIKDGEKIYWICPLIEESENLSATPLFKRYEEFKKVFDKNEIGFIHGKLNENEKDKIIDEFSKQNGKIKILIATTVIEVGIDVPNATIIIIESPERFGLSQIHQLRGRVGRGEKQSYCVLFYDKLTKNLKKRMDILKTSSNGFFIAEEDLKLRGSGEVLGLKQSGYQEYLIADFSDHYDLLLEAAKMARFIVNNRDLLNSYPIKILLELFGYNECLNEAILN